MSDELRGWKEICGYLGTSISTAQRWERDMALPVHRIGNSPGATVYAHASELDAWRRAYEEMEHVQTGTNAPAVLDIPSASSPEPSSSQVQDARPGSQARGVERSRVQLARFLLPFAVSVVILAVPVVILVGRWTAASRAVHPGQPIAPYSAQKTTSIVVLKISTPDNRQFVTRVPDGTMVTVAVPGLVKLGLTATIRDSGLKVGICEITPTRTGAEALKVLRITALGKMAVSTVAWGHSNVGVEWLGTDAAEPAKASPDSDNPPAKCCVTCDRTVVCASQVVGPCGSCRALAGRTGVYVPK